MYEEFKDVNSSSSNVAAAVQLRHRRNRIFRARKDVLNDLTDYELIERYRLNRAGINFVTNQLQSPTKRNMSLDAELKVIITLRYLATGKIQLCNGDDLGISQPTVSRVINQTLNALVIPAILHRFISMPSNAADLNRTQVQFQAIGGFPGVIGVIDGTHVRIIAPHVNEPEFVCRKGFHSINVQVVMDANYKILNIVAKWPGSVHDSRIWNNSNLRHAFLNNQFPHGCHLLGDSGYPCRPHLLTPYLRPQPGQQTNYNRSHKITRSLVERGIGQMKRRFRVLHSEVRLEPIKVCKVIVACAILHNICKNLNVPMNAGDGGGNNNGGNGGNIHQGPVAADGIRYRQQITQQYF
ncbi:putative nuclease HARBI1 [Haliotis cracherodii]|uniref:putative nuclease HARBI1 n=1 Tax=Haliotis cracherodii TaxID=6455 RepID=UPI0039EA4DCD